MWRGEVRRGRAGQAFDFGEPGVLDGATAKSLAAGRHEPQQVGQIVRTKPMRRSCWRILDRSLKPREPALQATGWLSSPVRSRLPNHASSERSRPSHWSNWRIWAIFDRTCPASAGSVRSSNTSVTPQKMRGEYTGTWAD